MRKALNPSMCSGNSLVMEVDEEDVTDEEKKRNKKRESDQTKNRIAMHGRKVGKKAHDRWYSR